MNGRMTHHLSRASMIVLSTANMMVLESAHVTGLESDHDGSLNNAWTLEKACVVRFSRALM